MTNEEKIDSLSLWLADHVGEQRLRAQDTVDNVWYDSAIKGATDAWREAMLGGGHLSQHIGYSSVELFLARNKALGLIEKRLELEPSQPHREVAERAPASTEGHPSAFQKAFAAYLASSLNIVALKSVDNSPIEAAWRQWQETMRGYGFSAELVHDEIVPGADALAIAIQKREALERDPVAMVAHLRGIIARAHADLTNGDYASRQGAIEATVLILEEGLDQ